MRRPFQGGEARAVASAGLGRAVRWIRQASVRSIELIFAAIPSKQRHSALAFEGPSSGGKAAKKYLTRLRLCSLVATPIAPPKLTCLGRASLLLQALSIGINPLRSFLVVPCQPIAHRSASERPYGEAYRHYLGRAIRSLYYSARSKSTDADVHLEPRLTTNMKRCFTVMEVEDREILGHNDPWKRESNGPSRPSRQSSFLYKSMQGYSFDRKIFAQFW